MHRRNHPGQVHHRAANRSGQHPGFRSRHGADITRWFGGYAGLGKPLDPSRCCAAGTCPGADRRGSHRSMGRTGHGARSSALADLPRRKFCGSVPAHDLDGSGGPGNLRRSLGVGRGRSGDTKPACSHGCGSGGQAQKADAFGPGCHERKPSERILVFTGQPLGNVPPPAADSAGCLAHVGQAAQGGSLVFAEVRAGRCCTGGCCQTFTDRDGLGSGVDDRWPCAFGSSPSAWPCP